MTSGADGPASIEGSTATTCCDGGDPAVWFTLWQLFASSPTGESVSRMQAERTAAPTVCMDGRLSTRGTCRPFVEAAADEHCIYVKVGSDGVCGLVWPRLLSARSVCGGI